MRYKLIQIGTFITCTCTCLAYEAMRIMGRHNRHGSSDWDGAFHEIPIPEWESIALLIYPLMFLPFIVVMCNKNNPETRLGWFLFSLAMLIISCVNIPGAYDGRYMSTSDWFFMFYLFVLPIPSIVFIIKGTNANN